MKRNEFINNVTNALKRYIDNFDMFEPDPQLSVNPDSLFVDVVNGRVMQEAIGYSEEAVEDAAGAQGAATEDGSDFQVTQNPDFYPVRKLIKKTIGTPSVEEPDPVAIEALANNYFK